MTEIHAFLWGSRRQISSSNMHWAKCSIWEPEKLFDFKSDKITSMDVTNSWLCWDIKGDNCKSDNNQAIQMKAIKSVAISGPNKMCKVISDANLARLVAQRRVVESRDAFKQPPLFTNVVILRFPQSICKHFQEPGSFFFMLRKCFKTQIKKKSMKYTKRTDENVENPGLPII